MTDDEYGAYRDLEKRIREIENREAGRDVKVEVAMSAMNRLAGFVGAAGITILGAVVAFVLTGGR